MSAVSALTLVSPTHSYSVYPPSRVCATARVCTQASTRPYVPFICTIKRCSLQTHKNQALSQASSSAVQASTRPSVSPFPVPLTRKIKRCRPPPHKIKRRPIPLHKSAFKRCSASPHTIKRRSPQLHKRCRPPPHKIKPLATQAQASLKTCACAVRTCPSLEHTSPCTQDRRNRSHGTTTTTCECVCACVRVCVCVCVSACV